MMTITQVNKILKAIKELKIELIKAQDFENAAVLRIMEKEYLDKKVIDEIEEKKEF